VDDFSSKLDLPMALETVESIDANHMQMARYCSKDDQGYRAISGVLKSFVRQELDGAKLDGAKKTLSVIPAAEAARTVTVDEADCGQSELMYFRGFNNHIPYHVVVCIDVRKWTCLGILRTQRNMLTSSSHF
jgi:hypothetical protein